MKVTKYEIFIIMFHRRKGNWWMCKNLFVLPRYTNVSIFM